MPRKPPRRVQAVPRMMPSEPRPAPIAEPPRRPRGTASDPPRSVRVSDKVWNRAKAKAKAQGYTSSFVIQTLLDAYGQGEIEMPRLVIDFGGAQADTARRGEK